MRKIYNRRSDYRVAALKLAELHRDGVTAEVLNLKELGSKLSVPISTSTVSVWLREITSLGVYKFLKDHKVEDWTIKSRFPNLEEFRGHEQAAKVEIGEKPGGVIKQTKEISGITQVDEIEELTPSRKSGFIGELTPESVWEAMEYINSERVRLSAAVDKLLILLQKKEERFKLIKLDNEKMHKERLDYAEKRIQVDLEKASEDLIKERSY